MPRQMEPLLEIPKSVHSGGPSTLVKLSMPRQNGGFLRVSKFSPWILEVLEQFIVKNSTQVSSKPSQVKATLQVEDPRAQGIPGLNDQRTQGFPRENSPGV